MELHTDSSALSVPQCRLTLLSDDFIWVLCVRYQLCVWVRVRALAAAPCPPLRLEAANRNLQEPALGLHQCGGGAGPSRRAVRAGLGAPWREGGPRATASGCLPEDGAPASEWVCAHRRLASERRRFSAPCSVASRPDCDFVSSSFLRYGDLGGHQDQEGILAQFFQRSLWSSSRKRKSSKSSSTASTR